MTYEDIYTKVMEFNHYDVDTDIEMLSRVKQWVNSRYRKIMRKILDRDPSFNRGNDNLISIAMYDTGTVTTNGTTSIIGSGTTFTSAMVGRKFKLTSYNEVYTIAAYVSATEITLSDSVNDDADSALSYVIYQDEIDLPSDCSQVVSIQQYLSSILLTKIGLSEMRYKITSSSTDSDTSTILDPVYWAFLSTSTIILYPYPTRQILLTLDYIKKIVELSNDDDEPCFPDDFHDILVIGARIDLLDYNDDNRAELERREFSETLADLIMHTVKNTDKPSLSPIVYRS